VQAADEESRRPDRVGRGDEGGGERSGRLGVGRGCQDVCSNGWLALARSLALSLGGFRCVVFVGAKFLRSRKLFTDGLPLGNPQRGHNHRHEHTRGSTKKHLFFHSSGKRELSGPPGSPLHVPLGARWCTVVSGPIIFTH